MSTFDVDDGDRSILSPTVEVAAVPGRRRNVAIVAGVVAGLAFVGLAFAAVTFLTAAGTQPESVLPRSTLAFARLDLDPAANQKIAFVEFISKFPSTFKDLDPQDPLASIFNALSKDRRAWERIRPWLGDRYAVAAVPSARNVEPVVVLAITDEPKMRAYFARQSPGTHIAVTSGYALLAEKQSTLDAITASPEHLSDSPDFASDLRALPGDQVVVVWADLTQAAKYGSEVADALAGASTAADMGSALQAMTGRIAGGLHFAAGSAVFTVLGRGVQADGQRVDASAVTEDVGSLPADTLAALSFAGVGKSLSKTLAKDPAVAKAVQDLGLRTTDVVTAFSGPVTLAVLAGTGGSTNVLLQLTPEHAARTKAAIKHMASQLIGGTLPFASRGGHLYFSINQEMLKQAMARISAATSELRDLRLFQQAVPSPGALVLFINMERALPLLHVTGDARQLAAVGIVAKATDSGDSSATFTITLR